MPQCLLDYLFHEGLLDVLLEGLLLAEFFKGLLLHELLDFFTAEMVENVLKTFGKVHTSRAYGIFILKKNHQPFLLGRDSPGTASALLQ